MSEIFFTSDLHINHDKEFLWGPRGFSNVKEMNEAIVERWNSVVKEEDIVYTLGDIAMNDAEGAIAYLNQLNGHQIWLLGNHDTSSKIDKVIAGCERIFTLHNYEQSSYATMLKRGKLSLYLSHYPTLTANYDEKHFNQHVISLHGHTHQQKNWLQPENPFLYHVGMDSHNCTPVHIEEVISDIRNQWNAIGALPIETRPLYNYPIKGDEDEVGKTD